MRVLLVYECPVLKHISLNQAQPLGLLYIASYLESKGIRTDVIDYSVESRRDVDYADYGFVGFSLNAGNIENTLKSIKKIKSGFPKTKIVLGGPHCRIVKDAIIMDRNVDCVILDEAEDIFYNFIMAKDKKTVKGICIKHGGKPYYTGSRGHIDDLDRLPFPSIEKVPFKKYRMVLSKKSPVCAINTSRGCPDSCIFCYHSLGHKYRVRSPKSVIEEIISLRTLGIKELYVTDDNFSEDIGRVEKICDMLIKEKIGMSISLANGIRADKAPYGLLKKFREAGVWFITFAPEVGSDASLIRIRKGFTKSQVREAVKNSKRLGFVTMSNFVVGFPWETRKDLRDTKEFALELDTDMMNVNRLIPYPRTPVWEMTEKGGYNLLDEKRSFTDSRFKHPLLSETEIQDSIRTMNREFYSLGRILRISQKIGVGAVMKMAEYTIRSRLM
jgi:anaerobic magnesium-protoporphyrin IX monomethyl ester cyclase